jgi:hypothetical protein
MFYIFIREVLGSNLGHDTGYPERGVSLVLLSTSRQIPRDYLDSTMTRQLPSKFFQINLSRIVLLFTVILYYMWASCCIDVSLTHSPPSLMQLQTLRNLSLIWNSIKMTSTAACSGLIWSSSGNYSISETVALHYRVSRGQRNGSLRPLISVS